MAVIATVIYVVGTVKPCHQLQQKAGFVAASSAEVPKRFVCRKLLELRSDPIEGIVPRDSMVAITSLFIQKRLDQSTRSISESGLALNPVHHRLLSSLADLVQPRDLSIPSLVFIVVGIRIEANLVH